ncbi:uncharacterized protein LOC126900875 isoform X2 [Daktulosphaira vitifoliae]|uniref:uncharacterized protein LOC126900875 isoform X2 n=1 Tax=Daktulosphaira vitifoliae TaxID=58002 RepID=UPI0021A9B2CC|nr:uncharacterized protein LOC126900875 isoform X2 [Daktulosphaira vitifoliae]
MLLTLYYMAATLFQSYRLANLKANLKKFILNSRSIVMYKEKDFTDIDNENLGTCYSKIFKLFRPRGISSDSCKYSQFAQLDQIVSIMGHKRSCSIFPEQILNLDTWIQIPSYKVAFPVLLNTHSSLKLDVDSIIHLLIEANYQIFNQRQNVVQYCTIENYGNLKAWYARENFSLLMETDLNHLAMLSKIFMDNSYPIFLGNNMELYRIQTVKVEGQACAIDNHEFITSTINFAYCLEDPGDKVTPITAIQWKIFCDALCGVSQTAAKVSISGKPTHYGSVIISKDVESLINVDDHHIVKSKSDNVYSEFVETKCSKNVTSIHNTSKDNIQYVRFCNNYETDVHQNEMINFNDINCNSSCSSSSESLDLKKSILCPISNNIKSLSNGIKPIKSSPDVFGILKRGNYNSVSLIRNNKSFSDFTNHPESRTRCHTPVQHRGEIKTGKPPNIIIFSDSASSAQQISNSLEAILHRYRYTIYILSLEKMLQSPWSTQATMVVIYGSVPEKLYALLEKYLLIEGGRILSICSDFLGTLLPSAFSMAEVRSDDLVSFTYRPLSIRISLLHHFLCYQPSTSYNTQFSTETNEKKTNDFDFVDVYDSNNKHYSINVEVLAAEDTWETPSLILATVPSGGRIIFSQVHLEIDFQHNNDNSSLNSERNLLLKDLLSTYLGLDCSVPPSEQEPNHTPAYLLGYDSDKYEFLQSLKGKGIENNVLLLKDLQVQFCKSNEISIHVGENSMPIIYDDIPKSFNEIAYFKNLQTEYLGRIVIFGDVMSTSMRLLHDPILKHGLVVIPKQQITGIGRGGNKWLSPYGCAMFSIQLHIPFNSKLGQRLALLQHVVALSVVSAICSLPGGYDELDLGLKWPNDIYAGGNAKIGGLVISSSAVGNNAICSIVIVFLRMWSQFK